MWPAASSHLRMSVAWSGSSSRYAMRIPPLSGCGALAAPGAEALEEFLAFLARRLDAALLDVAEAADLVGERGDLDRGGLVLRVQRREQQLDRLLVLADQFALHAPLFGVTERIERGAPQELELLQNFENRQDPAGFQSSEEVQVPAG